MLQRFLGAVIVLFVLTGCLDTSVDPAPQIGTATGEVTGDVERTLEGGSAFASDWPEDIGYGIVLEDGSGTLAITVVSGTVGRPSEGTYELGDEDSGLYADLTHIPAGSSEIERFVSRAGVLIIDSSSSLSLDGEVLFDGVSEDGSTEIQVVASFEASCVPQFGCD